MKTIGIIPARLDSSRLPGKLLLDETGKPLLQYTWEAACRAESLNEVIVATDSEEIAACVRNFGGRAELTGEHPSGTDRIAEIARRCCPDADLLVNIQGDEPEIDPDQIDELAALVAADPNCEMATLATPITSLDDRDDPSCVKVVCAADGRALYFSRAPIPHVRDAEASGSRQAPVALEQSAPEVGEDNSRLTPAARLEDSPWLLHLGIYAYRRDFLLRLTGLPPSRLEQMEKLEQLRALEAGALIRVGIVEHPAVGIDTPEDYARFVARERERAA